MKTLTFSILEAWLQQLPENIDNILLQKTCSIEWIIDIDSNREKKMEDELKKLREENQLLYQRIKKERKEKERLIQQVEKLSSEKERLESKVSKLEEEIEQIKLKPDPAGLKQQMEKYKAESKQKEMEIMLLREEIKELKEGLDSMQKQLDRERNKNRELERKLQEKGSFHVHGEERIKKDKLHEITEDLIAIITKTQKLMEDLIASFNAEKEPKN